MPGIQKTMLINELITDNRISVTMTASDLEAFAQAVAEKTVASINNLNTEPVKWLTPSQVCERLDIDRSTLWRWGKEGYLEGVKFGCRIRYRESDVIRVEVAEKRGEA